MELWWHPGASRRVGSQSRVAMRHSGFTSEFNHSVIWKEAVTWCIPWVASWACSLHMNTWQPFHYLNGYNKAVVYLRLQDEDRAINFRRDWAEGVVWQRGRLGISQLCGRWEYLVQRCLAPSQTPGSSSSIYLSHTGLRWAFKGVPRSNRIEAGLFYFYGFWTSLLYSCCTKAKSCFSHFRGLNNNQFYEWM